MNVSNGIQYIDTEVQDEHDAEELVRRLCPEWSSEKVVVSSIPQGRVNCMLLFHKQSDTLLQEGLVVRINGTNLDSVVNHNKQIMAFQVGVAAGCAPPLKAIYRNGFIYSYVNGRTLTMKDCNDPEIIRKVAQKLADFHMQDISHLDLIDVKGKPGEINQSNTLLDTLMSGSRNYPEHLKDQERDDMFQKYKLQKEEFIFYTNKVVHLIEELDFPTRLNHGDFNLSNILHNDDTGDVFFVDYELTECRPEAMDMCAMFGNRTLWDYVGLSKPDDPQMTPELRRHWIRSYLERKFEQQGKDANSVTTTDLEKSDIEHKITEFALTTLNIIYITHFAQIPDFYCNTLGMYPGYTKLWHQQKHALDNLARRYNILSNGGQP